MSTSKLSAGTVKLAIKRAKQKALVKDAAKILVGLRKRAGVAGRHLARTALKQTTTPKTSNAKRFLLKVGARAIVVLKRGTSMQKRAAIADVLRALAGKAVSGVRTMGAHAMRGTGAALKGVGGAAEKVGLGGIGKSVSRAGSKIKTQGGRALRSASGKGFRSAGRVGAGIVGAAGLGGVAALSGGDDKKPEKKSAA